MMPILCWEVGSHCPGNRGDAMARIIITGDIVPTDSNKVLFQNADVNALLGPKLNAIMSEADFIISNLEAPLYDENEPIRKCGPNLRSSSATISGLKAINPFFYGLANNHILDHGGRGLLNTINILDSNGIAHAGADSSLSHALKPFITDLKGVKIGIYCCAEHEFSIASNSRAGANPYDPLESFDHVFNLKNRCDYVIVMYHGGKEYYRYPSPNLQKICRKFIDKGADLVVCQHSHCIGCEEKWMNGTIVYGQGNFIFDGSNSEYWMTSLLIQIDIESSISIKYIPICKVENVVRLAENETKEEILQNFTDRSQEITRENFIQESYHQFACTMKKEYLRAISGKRTKTILFRAINVLSGRRFSNYYYKRMYGPNENITINNYIECEAHRELFLEGLK